MLLQPSSIKTCYISSRNFSVSFLFIMHEQILKKFYRPNTVSLFNFILILNIDNSDRLLLLYNSLYIDVYYIWNSIFWHHWSMVLFLLSSVLLFVQNAWWNGWKASKKNWKLFASWFIVWSWVWCFFNWVLNFYVNEIDAGR